MVTGEQRTVVELRSIDAASTALVGGKAAQLGVLSRMRGVTVPAGFCVTTAAFGTAVAADPHVAALRAQLASVDARDVEALGAAGAALRTAITKLAIPAEISSEIRAAIGRLGDDGAYAVRSSATSEDSAGASFAGQHDSFLNVVGPDAVLAHVARCWASLYTDPAVSYRARQGLQDDVAGMAVVVQRMVPATAAGVLFTADPATGNRTTVSIEAVQGLGEDLVAGVVTPDGYVVRSGEIVDRSASEGQPVLSDAQVVGLATLGRHIEAELGHPQDIEWCLDGDAPYVVQSRPITTLFPVPDAGDDDRHVYVSVGHQQMMTDPMKPLGLSLFQMTAAPRMYEAGSRLFVDVAERLAQPTARAAVVAALGTSDPLIGDALQSLVDREFIAPQPDAAHGPVPPGGPPPAEPIATDARLVDELVEQTQASIAQLAVDIGKVSGPEVFRFITDDLQVLRRTTFDPRSMHVIMAAMDAATWLNERCATWLGETNVADTLSQSVSGNVTAQMGLDLLDVADAIRPHPEVIAFLEDDPEAGFLDGLVDLPGGTEARAAIEGYLAKYGMRCVGEIDLTRPRWSERPDALVPAILTNVRSFEPGAAARRFEDGRTEANAKAADLLARLRTHPEGAADADEAERMIERLRTFTGYREFPKYGIVGRYALYKQALLAEADRLVRTGVLRRREDCFFLRFDEFHEASRDGVVDQDLIDDRRAQFAAHERLRPPRVLTSDGEIVTGSYRRDDVPAGALVGLPVSSGTVEGRARVVREVADAELEPGDILVTTFTDPSWTPVFVAIAGLVTEVGGLMTHGAVIAREYGLPAVVGVEGATQRILDGQRIRVHGTGGIVELL